MPALKPTDITGRITWIGRVLDRDTSLAAEALDRAELTFEGIAGECHGGLTRASCSRVSAQHPKGTTIRNVRQLTILSAEELAATAAEMGLDTLDPAWVGASLIVEGIPDFTHVPPSSRLQAPSGATIVVDMENRPCIFPGKEVIEVERPGHGKKYKSAAQGRRGVTAWIEREGAIALGDDLRLHIPDQRAWIGAG